MYSDHPSCIPPADPNIKIWRYLDIAKLLAVIEHESLYFPCLATLEDPLEGFLNQATVEKMRKLPDGAGDQEILKMKAVVEHNLRVFKESRNWLYVSSWHMNNYESAAMWKLYASHNSGVAIQSTYGRLKDSLNKDEISVSIGTVKYIDERNDIISWGNILNYGLHKRISFQHEQELRAIVMSPTFAAGCLVKVDIKRLIEKIYVSPDSEAWIQKLLQKVMSRYNFEIPVEQSQLNQDPLY